MRFATFAGQDGKAIYVNPFFVLTVQELSENAAFLTFALDHGLTIPLQAKLVAEDLEKASSA